MLMYQDNKELDPVVLCHLLLLCELKAPKVDLL